MGVEHVSSREPQWLDKSNKMTTVGEFDAKAKQTRLIIPPVLRLSSFGPKLSPIVAQRFMTGTGKDQGPW
jgi:hypothetical protein